MGSTKPPSRVLEKLPPQYILIFHGEDGNEMEPLRGSLTDAVSQAKVKAHLTQKKVGIAKIICMVHPQVEIEFDIQYTKGEGPNEDQADTLDHR